MINSAKIKAKHDKLEQHTKEIMTEQRKYKELKARTMQNKVETP